MAKKTKKKAAPKMKEEVKPYVIMTEEQYDDLKSLMLWDNPMSDLSTIASDSDSNQLEIIFQLGKIYKSFEIMFEKMNNLMSQIVPEDDDTTSGYEWDSSEDDYEETEEEETEDEENN
jgi:hypothetical protein